MTTPAISTPVSLPSFIDAASDAVARAIAGMQRQAAHERELRDAEHRARLLELQARYAAAERLLADRLGEIKDGVPGTSVTVDDVAPLIVAEVERAVASLPRAKDGQPGKDADIEAIDRLIAERVAEAVAAIPAPKDGDPGERGADAPHVTSEQVLDAVRTALAPEEGVENPVAREVHRWLEANPPVAGQDGRDGKDGERGEQGERGFGLDDFDTELAEEGRVLLLKFSRGDTTEVHEIPLPVGPAGADGKDGADGERGPEGPVGALPMVVEWSDGVHYHGEALSHRGAIYQAIRDTGKEPGHEDWRCIVERGVDGADGRSITPRGLYDEAKSYSALDIVMLNGASFVAKIDEPGPCPGEGWNLLAAQGKQGKPGLPGERGERGLAVTASVRAAEVSNDGLLTLTNADGSKVECDLYPLLSRLT